MKKTYIIEVEVTDLDNAKQYLIDDGDIEVTEETDVVSIYISSNLDGDMVYDKVGRVISIKEVENSDE